MQKTLKLVEEFVQQTGQSMLSFQERLGTIPRDPRKFSLWVAGALPRKLAQQGTYFFILFYFFFFRFVGL